MITLDQAKNTARQYLESLKGMGIPVDRMYLFGSISRGIQHESSDIDIAVVSTIFGRCRPDERVQLLVARGIKYLEIEPHPIGLVDFNENDWDPFMKEVKKGIRIV